MMVNEGRTTWSLCWCFQYRYQRNIANSQVLIVPETTPNGSTESIDDKIDPLSLQSELELILQCFRFHPECTLKVLNKTNMGSIPSLRAEILLRHHVGRVRPLDQIGIQWGPGPPWLVCHKLTITSLATPRLTSRSYRVDWGSYI